MRRRVAGAAAALAVVAVAVALLRPVVRPASPRPEPSGGTLATSTAPVVRRSLVARTQVDATLGHAGAYAVVNQAPGVITRLPRIGAVVRQGQVLYRVGGRPVILLYGPVPAYRDLAYGMRGRDVAALNAALAALGHATRSILDPRSHRFGLATVHALERLQRRVGLPRTGALSLGQAVFLPGAARITSRAAVPGGPARPGATVLSATSTRPVITVRLDAAQQADVRAGDKVKVTLPSGRTTPGVVSSVGRVATKSSSGGGYTVTVTVAPARPRAAGGLDQAPVQVSIVTGGVRDALVVPVTALLARGGGTYAVEVADPRGNHLVTVSLGLFDSADGLVQVTGAGLSAGQRVVVPTA